MALGLAATGALAQVTTVPGMPPVLDAQNLYSEIGAGKMSPALADHRELVYVPHVQSNDIYVIDPTTFKVIDKYKVGLNPQHVVPSWDMQTLWVTNNAERTNKGSLTPIDPKTGKPGKAIPVHDPYNMYFSPDGKTRHRRRGGREAPRLPRREDDGVPVLHRDAAVRGREPRRLLHRRLVTRSSPASSPRAW